MAWSSRPRHARACRFQDETDDAQLQADNVAIAPNIGGILTAEPIAQQTHHLFFGAIGGAEEALKTLLARLFETVAPPNPLRQLLRGQ